MTPNAQGGVLGDDDEHSPKKVAWGVDDDAFCKEKDLERSEVGELAGTSPEESRALRCGWIALDVAASAMLSVSLMLAPTIFGILAVALLWRKRLNLLVHTIFLILLLFIMCAPPCTICCHSRRESSAASMSWLRRRRILVAVSLFLGIVGFLAFFTALFHTDLTTPELNGDYDVSKPVAVVGSGPSGLSAAWLLAKGGRRVHIFESLGEIGGHSKSWVEEANGRNLTIDLGFIFNNGADGAYTSYKDIATHFNNTLRSSALNVSGSFNGEIWDNTGDPERFDPELKEEIRRFMAFVESPPSTIRLLTPMALWLWYHGFSDRFRKLCLDSTMSVLFVTKMGLDKQSAQAVLSYFGASDGFTHLRYDKDKVQFNPGGSQFMWKDVVADMESTGRAQVHLNSEVAAVQKEDGLWTLTLADGSMHGGFADVVLGCPANVASKIVRGRPIETLIVDQISYIDADVTLHTDRRAVQLDRHGTQSANEVLYYIGPNHMTGQIGKVFQDDSSNLLLTVHGQEHESLAIDPSLIKWSTKWSHHFFSIFELCIGRKFVPMFNNVGGLHFAGDWLYGVGHNDAIKSGVHAACAAGLPARPPDASSDPLYSKLIAATCRLPS